ncbi:MAG: redox-regulated ATPase YchF [Candidatus Altiarchaeota archaeon]|nr:redox-regulated ATPase YchF [Candidatus Altiarchaeota archaeon]
MEVGVVGKPNVGKSTFFKALTLADAEIANFPFTTIKPNIGVGYVKSACPCRNLGVACSPRNSYCRSGFRFTPVKMIDVAGLVPGAHKGKGLGNQFLDDLRQADVLIHIVDISGRTNEKGEPAVGHDPELDIKFLEDEINLWFASVVKRNWSKISSKIRYEGGKIIKEWFDVLSGLSVSEGHIKSALDACGLLDKRDWSDEDLNEFAFRLREASKPIVIAANKIDLGGSNYNRLKEEYDLTPVCAEAELALREADKHGLIEYVPGEKGFKVVGSLDEKKGKALDFIKAKILDQYGSTGVQECLNHAVCAVLNNIVVYPVENETKYSDSKGNVLPDSYLVRKESTALDMAYKVHTDIGDKFIGAIDCKTKMKVGRDHKLKDGDVLKIIAGR